MDDFLGAAEVALTACDVVLRRPDKKKERQLLTTQRHELIERLGSASDAALVLHIAVLLLFHTVTQTLLSASGRFVPQIGVSATHFIGYISSSSPSVLSSKDQSIFYHKVLSTMFIAKVQFIFGINQAQINEASCVIQTFHERKVIGIAKLSMETKSFTSIH